MPYKNKITWSVRVEPELKKKLQDIAKLENRSLNNLMEYFLGYMVDYYKKAPIRPIDDLLHAYDALFSSDEGASKPRDKQG